MHSPVRVILLTSDQHRHRFLARRLAASGRVSLVGIVAERKRAVVLDPVACATSPADAAILKQHFSERETAEARWLGADSSFPPVDVRHIAAGSINAREVRAWVLERRPDVVQLFGTGLIKAEFLDEYPDRIVNLHLGLSPYYRGTATNFWPIACGEPECVGATIHLATAKVDAGPILAQVRPEVAVDDRTHDLGTKTLVAAADAIAGVLERFVAGAICPVGQDWSTGRVYRARDFNADAVRASWWRLDEGLIRAYLADKEARQARFPIVGVPTSMG